jgi:hypothetical protein
VPLYVLGFMGMTRRLNHYDNPAWHPWLVVAAFGAVLIAIGIAASCCSSSSYPQPQPAGLSRRDRRPVGRPYAGMGDLVAAGRLQLRGASEGARSTRMPT